MSTRHAFPFRVPSDVKSWLEAQAEFNGSSQNSEIIRAIRAAMAQEAARAPDTSQRAGYGAHTEGDAA